MTTDEVFKDHLAKRKAGKTEQDIKTNYAADVLIMSSEGVFKGHEGVRESAKKLTNDVGQSDFSYDKTFVDGERAFLIWSAHDGSKKVCEGADSFLIKDGKITLQTVFYRLLSS